MLGLLEVRRRGLPQAQLVHTELLASTTTETLLSSCQINLADLRSRMPLGQIVWWYFQYQS